MVATNEFNIQSCLTHRDLPLPFNTSAVRCLLSPVGLRGLGHYIAGSVRKSAVHSMTEVAGYAPVRLPAMLLQPGLLAVEHLPCGLMRQQTR